MPTKEEWNEILKDRLAPKNIMEFQVQQRDRGILRRSRESKASELSRKLADSGVNRTSARNRRIFVGKLKKTFLPAGAYLGKVGATAAGIAATAGALKLGVPLLEKTAGHAVNSVGKKALKYGTIAGVPLAAAAVYKMNKSNVDNNKYYLYNDDKIRTFDTKEAAERYRASRPDEHYTMNKGATLRQKLED